MYASVLAKEHPELRIHAFRPGKVNTPMQAEIRATTEEDFPGVAHFVEEFESGSLVLPETVATSLLHVIDRKDEIPVIFSTSNYTV
jgi:benzil reductase ((S)-benzoin forming)